MRKLLLLIPIVCLVLGIIVSVHILAKTPQVDPCAGKNAVGVKHAHGRTICIRQDVVVK